MAEMVRYALAVFVVLHGLVHLLYFGQSARLLELQAGMDWPDHSWALSQLASSGAIRGLASAVCLLAAAGFVAAGVGVFADVGWWRGALGGAAALSTAAWILLWDASPVNLSGQHRAHVIGQLHGGKRLNSALEGRVGFLVADCAGLLLKRHCDR